MADFLLKALPAGDALFTGASLNALGPAAGVLGSEVDNTETGTPKRCTHMHVWVAVDTDIVSVGTDARIDLYLVPANGATYPDPPGSTALDVTESYYVGPISSVKRGGTVTNFLSGWLMFVPIPQTKFKMILVNALGAALPANANTVVTGFRFNLADA